MAVFWDVTPFTLVDINRYFKGAYGLHNQDLSTSETSDDIYETAQSKITEDSSLPTHKYKNLKPHQII
jgi:hypothetical protein